LRSSERYCTPGAMNSANKIPLRSHNTYLTAGGRGDGSVHDSSVITATLYLA
jgi:hypothetical protein